MLSEYQSLIDSAESDSNKAELYSDRADDVFDLYIDNEEYDLGSGDTIFADDELAETYKSQVIADATAADELVLTPSTAEALAHYYKYFGDTDSSNYYKELASSRTLETNNVAE